MLVSGRIAELRRLAAQVGRAGTFLQTRPANDPVLQARRDKLLFRRVPVTLSLVERSVSGLDRASPSRAAPRHLLESPRLVAAPDDAHGEGVVAGRAVSPLSTLRQPASGSPRLANLVWGLLQPLCVLESARKITLAEKQEEIERRRQRLLQGVRADVSTPAGDQAAVAAEHRRSDVRACDDDLAMLRGSLIARPFLSARLWRFLLREEAWVSIVQSVAPDAPGYPKSQQRLLSAVLHLSQLTLGVVVDYVQGSEVNRASPRFAVSLPSAAWRARKKVSESPATHTAGVVATPAVEGEDPLTSMLLEAMHSSVEPPPSAITAVSSSVAKSKRRGATELRWMPVHASRSVVSLAQETLALLTFVTPSLDVGVLVESNRSESLLTLLVTVQQLGRVVLAAQQTGSTVSPTAEDAKACHGVLTRLQTVLLQTACELKQVVAEACAREFDGNGAAMAETGTARWSPSQGAAARFVVELDALYLLRPGEAHSDALVDHLVLCMFPQLRTNTLSVLQQRARASSLLTFTTRRHRTHLYQQHTGRLGAAQYLEGTVIQQSRLQHRQLAAALRERRLSDVHMQTLFHLSAALTPADLLTLFQVLVVRAHAAHQSASTVHTLSTDRAITAALFTAEALLLSSAVVASDVESLLSPGQLVRLWLSVVTLWPVVANRETMRRAVASAWSGRGHRSSGDGDTRVEKAALTFLAEFVLKSISAVLAEGLGSAAGNGARRDALASLPQAGLSASDLQALAVGLTEWSTVCVSPSMGSGGGPLSRNAALQASVDAVLKLLRKTVLQSTTLWHTVRAWDGEARQGFERTLLECFQLHHLVDGAVTEAIVGMCHAGIAAQS